MFASQAHSFTQQARLAITLAWVAGYTNILTVITCGTVTSHVSGTASNLGREVSEGSWAIALFSLFLLLSFFLGATTSGALTEVSRRRGWDSVYALPIAAETLLLAMFALGLEVHDHGVRQSGAPLYWMTGVASFAMGLQNATITRISSGVVRTSHITGVLTDLGLETTQFILWVRDRKNVRSRDLLRTVVAHPSAKRLTLLASIVGSFALGAGLGTVAHDQITRWAMFPPVAFLIWLVYRDLRTPIATITPSELIREATGLELPTGVLIFRLAGAAGGQANVVHRMPDLLRWADRLPSTTRIVVLDIGDAPPFNTNDVLELSALLRNFEHKGWKLIFAGLSAQQLHQIRSAGTLHLLDPANFCPDLELAVARALALTS
jgi:uncharacterized membrane protein YoaK (UPF0700 family)